MATTFTTATARTTAMTDEQQFSFRQSKGDMAEIHEIAMRVARHRDKFRRQCDKHDEEWLALEALELASQWLSQARSKNPLRPLGPALELARHALRAVQQLIAPSNS